MEQLVQLFPEHRIDVLRNQLDGAGGILEIAVERLLSSPIEFKSIPSSSADHGSSVPKGKATQSNKRQKHCSVNESFSSTSAVLLDLTIDSSDDEKGDGKEVGKYDDDDDISILPQSTWEFYFPEDNKPGSSNSEHNSVSIPSFESFHSEQLKFQEVQAKRNAEIELQRNTLVTNFIEIATDMFKDISEPYLVNLLKEKEKKYPSNGELIDACIESIVALKGKYPTAKAKRKRSSDGDLGRYGGDGDPESDRDTSDDEKLWGEDSAESSSSNSRSKRDFMSFTEKMSAIYETECATQLYQDFPTITAASIRAFLRKFNFHYAPAFDYIQNCLAHPEINSDVRISNMQKPRQKKAMSDPKTLDPDFRKELQFIRSKIEKEAKEIQQAEEEEKNTQYYKERNELIECGCCYDDVPPNRMAQCEDGHLFCLECSKRGAEVELGYKRTVLKCMTAGCTAVFSDSEAMRYLPKPVFDGLLRARQQSELKMAGLDSLVECPFCSYAAVVENDMDKEFRCQAPKCQKVSCRLCQELTHIPLSCEEYQQEQERDNVLDAQHKVEERMTQALVRQCPKCKSRFYKTEGCNKMTCPDCGTKMCYVCKKQITDYSHFDHTPVHLAAQNKRLCRLWENSIERNANEVKEAAQKSLQELQAEMPDLAAKVQLDIS